MLEPFLRPHLSAFLFSPADAEAERRAGKHATRKRPLNHGNKPGSNVSAAPKRVPRDRYTVASYRRSIARACEKTFGMPKALREPESAAAKKLDVGEGKKERQRRKADWYALHLWHPHQLRHNSATLLRRLYGINRAASRAVRLLRREALLSPQ